MRRIARTVVALVVGAMLSGGTMLTAGPASAGVIGDRLGTGSTLQVGDVAGSPNGRWQFVMQADGNAVVYGPSGAEWSTGTTVPGSVLTVQADGNAVVLAPGPRPQWSTGTSGTGAALVMQDDGNLVLYSVPGTATWSSRTGLLQGRPSDRLVPGAQVGRGQVVQSPSGAFSAHLRADTGEFVVSGPHSFIWRSRVPGGDALVMQRDGNLVVYGNGRALWSTRTAGAQAGTLVMQDDGNLVVYRGGRAVWSSYSS